MKRLLFLFPLVLIVLYIFRPKTRQLFIKPSLSIPASKADRTLAKLNVKVAESKFFLKQRGFSTNYIFLIDMSLPSGRKRFFIYDLQNDSVLQSGLVAHGSCGASYLSEPRFSNAPDCGCSATGRYKIGAAYHGRFGKAFKLFGLDSSNSNAFKRAIVLHGYRCVPDDETSPYPICNSLGCPMVSDKFLTAAAKIIETSKKPILLWLYR